MLTYALAALVSLSAVFDTSTTLNPEHPGPVASIGAGLAFPEVLTTYASVFAGSRVSFDGYLTLNTVDAGLTYHGPLSGDASFLVQTLFGFTHAMVPSQYFQQGGMRFYAGGGYGELANWDFRATLGLSAAQVPAGWNFMPAGFITMGKTF